MFGAQFWKDAVERAVKTAAQTAVALIGTGSLGLFEIDWVQIGSVTAVAAILSVLTSVASDPVGDSGTASLVRGKHSA